jgi:alanine racemase
MVAVSNIGEAMQLRDAGITAPILMMNYLPPDAARQAIQQRITATVYDLDLARAYDAAGRETGGSLRVHVKIDTGMGRLGVAADKSVLLFRHLARLTNLDVEGVYTHFATADEDADYLAEQNRRFRDVIAPLKASGFPLRYIHAANSAATLRAPETHYNAVRVGLALYGLTPSDEVPLSASFRPVMSWKALVAQVKTLPPNSPVGYGATYRTSGEERIAILAVGFADGFRRAPHHAGEVLIHGEYAPVVGRVSMEKTAVNVSHIPDVAAGDEAVLLGRQGQREITAEDIAARLGTSNYEVVTTALPRQTRR